MGINKVLFVLPGDEGNMETLEKVWKNVGI